jgi:hypothetical protein
MSHLSFFSVSFFVYYYCTYNKISSMAEKHILSLEVPTVANCEILSIRDTSQYSDIVAKDCPELIIKTPVYNKPAIIEVTPGFDLIRAGCDLQIQTTNCGEENIALPDGVYVIRYSLSPNDKAFVEYNHLRTTAILNLYYEVLCGLNLADCEPSSDKQDLIKEVNYLRILIDSAKAQVEYCINPKKGMEMYDYALKRLRKILCTTTANC